VLRNGGRNTRSNGRTPKLDPELNPECVERDRLSQKSRPPVGFGSAPLVTGEVVTSRRHGRDEVL
jgi:hypothetical protein